MWTRLARGSRTGSLAAKFCVRLHSSRYLVLRLSAVVLSVALLVGVGADGVSAASPKAPVSSTADGEDEASEESLPKPPAKLGREPDIAAERAFYRQAAERFVRSSRAFVEALNGLVQADYQRAKEELESTYETTVAQFQETQRERRDEALVQMEAFVEMFPDSPSFSPDVLYRLAELHFERAYEQYFEDRQVYETFLATWTPDSNAPEPLPPQFDFAPTIELMKRVLIKFPNYRHADGAYYLLGYCLWEQGRESTAVAVYREMAQKYPDSHFIAEVWMRIGEFHFNEGQLPEAIEAYERVVRDSETPFFDKALYKLAWTHYRLADPKSNAGAYQKAVDSFVRLVAFNEETKVQGEERGAALRNEAVQYLGVIFADEAWGSQQRLMRFLRSRGSPAWGRDVLVALGDTLVDQTRYRLATTVYQSAMDYAPTHPEAPKLHQEILRTYELRRDYLGAADVVASLVERYSGKGAWVRANRGSEVALRAADKVVRQALYKRALYEHKRAQVFKEKGKSKDALRTYARAAAAYEKYLELFPHDRNLYKLLYGRAESLFYSQDYLAAAGAYAAVRDTNVGTHLREDSARSSVLAYEKAAAELEERGVVRRVRPRKASQRQPGEKATPTQMAQVKVAVVKAADAYRAVVEGLDESELSNEVSESVAKISYKAAVIYYAHDHVGVARDRFWDIIRQFPRERVAEYAANWLIESYLAEREYKRVLSMAQTWLDDRTFVRPGFQVELRSTTAGARFKIADSYAKEGNFEEAAERYVELVERYPQADLAASALNNAGVAFEKVKRYESASAAYDRVIRDYPRSPLADNALFRSGLNAERFFDFNRATRLYLRLVKAYPKSKFRADALYNAALALENLQQYDRSASQYARYCDLFPKRSDAPEVCFRAGAVYAKMGLSKRSSKTYRTFVNKYAKRPKQAKRVVEAHVRIGRTLERAGKVKDARKHFRKAVALHRKRGDDASAVFAAEADFRLVEPELIAFKKIKLEGNSKKQKIALKKKAKALTQAQERYKSILAYKQVEWSLAALLRMGQLYQHFAESLLQAPCPRDVKKAARQMGMTAQEVCDEYAVLLEEQAATVEDKAVEALEGTIERARELQVANVWTEETLAALHKLRSSQWPAQKGTKAFFEPWVMEPPALLDGMGRDVRVVGVGSTSVSSASPPSTDSKSAGSNPKSGAAPSAKSPVDARKPKADIRSSTKRETKSNAKSKPAASAPAVSNEATSDEWIDAMGWRENQQAKKGKQPPGKQGRVVVQ